MSQRHHLVPSSGFWSLHEALFSEKSLPHCVTIHTLQPWQCAYVFWGRGFEGNVICLDVHDIQLPGKITDNVFNWLWGKTCGLIKS